MGEDLIAQLAFLDDLKDKFDIFNVHESEAVRIPWNLLYSGAKGQYEAYTAGRMIIDAHVYYRFCLVVIDASKRRFLTENVIQKAHALETKHLNRWQNQLEIET